MPAVESKEEELPTRFRVAASTDAISLGKMFASSAREHSVLICECIGAYSTYNAVKAVINAQGHLASNGYDIVIDPFYNENCVGDNDGETVTGITLRILIGRRDNHA